MEMALTFNDVTLSPISHQNNLWIRAVELAHALGYAQENSVSRIYRSNSDEFTPDMTQVIEIFDGADSALSTKARIFSLRGCHLVAMFARTPVAKAFRRWVLDVLDKLDAEQHAASSSPTPDDFTGPLSITPSTTEDRKPLRALVGSWAQVSGLPFAACWNQLKAAFNLANIKELPQEWTRREASLRQEFMAMLRELDARRGDLFSYAVSDLGRNADTMFSPQCLLDSLFQSRTEAEQRFRQALDDASLHLRLSLNMAVALGR